jgi:hypothetical protein
MPVWYPARWTGFRSFRWIRLLLAEVDYQQRWNRVSNLTCLHHGDFEARSLGQGGLPQVASDELAAI